MHKQTEFYQRNLWNRHYGLSGAKSFYEKHKTGKLVHAELLS